jgi:hypothetical protein
MVTTRCWKSAVRWTWAAGASFHRYPSTSTPAATLASWFGVADGASGGPGLGAGIRFESRIVRVVVTKRRLPEVAVLDLPVVSPNIGNFSQRNLGFML